jgi:hypothetical protein
MDGFRIPVEPHRALAAYYEKVLECSFVLNGADFGHGEVFHHSGFLPMVVEFASRLSVRVFGQELPAQFASASQSLLGRKVELAEAATQPVILLLARAADLIFQPEKGKTIELYPMFEYSWLPVEQRKRAAWQPAGL